MIQGELLTVQEIALRLRVSKRTVYRWIEVGEILAFRIGIRKIVVPESEVAECLKPIGARSNNR